MTISRSRTNGAAVLEENDTSVASGRTMEAIAAGKGTKAQAIHDARMATFEADAVWDSNTALRPRSAKRARRRHEKAGDRPSERNPTMPDFIAPQLCETLARPPSGDGWIHEIKFDGYRIQMRVEDGKATLKTRKGLDWTAKYPAHRRRRRRHCPMRSSTAKSARSTSTARLISRRCRRRLSEGKTDDLVYFAFDLLFDGDEDLRELPLTERKERLASSFCPTPATIRACVSSSISKPAATQF